MEILFGVLDDIVAVVNDFAVFDNRVERGNTHHGAGGDGFSRTGLAYNRESFAFIEVETYVADGLNFAADGTERDS